MEFTFKYHYFGQEKLKNGQQGYILATWHENALGSILAQRKKKHVVMVSRSFDGEIIASFVKRRGSLSVRGSSRRGNVEKGGQMALTKIIDLLNQGVSAGITVDGPTGPAHKSKIGVAIMAYATGKPIIPYRSCPDKYWELRSWDKTRIPKFFSHFKVLYGDPIYVTSEDKKEGFKTVLEKLDQNLSKLDYQL